MKKSKYSNTLSLFNAMKKFPTNEQATKHLEIVRWGGKAKCLYCLTRNKISARKTIGRTAGQYRCNCCHKEFTVRTGTIFEKSHLPLNKWMFAIYLVQTARKGISSLQLSKELGITQKTAWFMLHRIREACKGDLTKLTGIVEIDETYIGGKEKNKHKNKRLKAARGAVGKTAIDGMRERKGKVEAMLIDNTDQHTLQTAIHRNINVGSQLYTDDHRGYAGLDGVLYQHKSVKHSANEYVNGMAHTNGIESVWAVLKRGVNGTYHNITTKHLQRYVGEFTFRLNEGNVERHTKRRIDSVLAGAIDKRLTYKRLIS